MSDPKRSSPRPDRSGRSVLDRARGAEPAMISTLAVALSLISGTLADGPAPAQPEPPFLHPLFTGHGIIQRDIPVPIWGYTTPGAQVKVNFANQSVETSANDSGKWMVKLGPFPAGGPHTLSVSGPKTVEVADVLVGDVWLCSGQSNMEWPVVGSTRGEEEVEAGDHPNIRLFTVPKNAKVKPVASVDAKWEVCGPKTVGEFSAVGYFFGREIERDVKVPVGLIDSSWGGTIAEAWIAAGSVAKIGDFDRALEAVRDSVDAPTKTPARYDRLLTTWWNENDPGSSGRPAWSTPSLDATAWKTMELPGNWEDRGLVDFDGIVWFRREITLPEAWDGKPITLNLGRIDDYDTTYLNGVEVGHREVWDVVRDYKVKAGVAKAGRNVIAVRVFDRQGLGGFAGPAEDFKITLTGDDDADPVSLKGPWSYQVSAKIDDISSPPERDEDNPNRVTVLYNGMIAPLEPFAIKGALWYQGEANASRPAQYRRVLPELIRDWRSHFEVGDFPFLIVQLANFQKRRDRPARSNWAELREAQYLTTKAVPNAQVALAIDIGEADDVHPRNKQEVGRRLALDALATVYGRSVEYSGPTFRSMEVHDNSIRLSFDHAAGGLAARGGGKLEGFAIAGKDGRFEWADAVIDGDGIVVSSTEVDEPVAVRYAWADNPACNLENRAGLPAVPFRTNAPEPGK